jgi:hypothetical protein
VFALRFRCRIQQGYGTRKTTTPHTAGGLNRPIPFHDC